MYGSEHQRDVQKQALETYIEQDKADAQKHIDHLK